jgi:hypothetical protein
LLDEEEMFVLDSFLKFSKSNEELKLLKRLRSFYAKKCLTESRRCIWNLLLVEFRRFILDFAETKKHEDFRNLTGRFKKAGGFVEKRDKCFFQRAMASFRSEIFNLRTSEPFLCRASSRDELQAQGKILFDLWNFPPELDIERNHLAMYLLMCHDHVALRRNMVRSEMAEMFRGCFGQIKMPFFTIFYLPYNKKYVTRFFQEPLIQSLWLMF